MAGGAEIAKQQRYVNQQSQNVDSVRWETADPVTGGTAFLNTSLPTPIVLRSEREPLGQDIDSTDPAELTQSTEPTSNSASNPEWQCQVPEKFYGGFDGMPHHCQMKILQDFSQGLDEIYGFTNKSRENNVAKMAELNDSPIPNFDASPEAEMMTYALQSTAKQQRKEIECPPGTKPEKDAKGKIQCVGTGVSEVKIEIPKPYDPEEGTDLFIKALDVSLFLQKRVTFIGFTDKQQDTTVKQLAWMLFWKPCADAFKEAGLPTLGERLKEYPLTIAHADLLKDSKNNTKLGILEDARLDLQGELYNEEAPAIATDKPYTERNYIFLKEKAFTGEIDTFNKVFPHETMHTAGANHNNRAYFLGIIAYGTDLSGFKNYEGVIKNCQFPSE